MCIDEYLLSTDRQIKVAWSAEKGGHRKGGGVGGQGGDAGGGHPVDQEPTGPRILILAGVQGRAGVGEVATAQRGLLTKIYLVISTTILIWPKSVLVSMVYLASADSGTDVSMALFLLPQAAGAAAEDAKQIV